MSTVQGIHHVTAIAGDAQQNVDFYAGVLGLRLVKKTVNFDDPTAYHLYYGDAHGSPGSLITFFPYARARKGRAGVGQVAQTSLSVPSGAIGYWLHRFVTHGVDHDVPSRRFGQTTLVFRDRDGLQLELVTAEPAPDAHPWTSRDISIDHAIRGVHGVTLWEHSLEATEKVLTEGLGFRRDATEGGATRFIVADGGPSRVVDVRVVGGFLAAVGGAGTVHHVAFRAEDDQSELSLSGEVTALGLSPTPVIDREYFRSVYFREPGGVLFELATDQPGFTVDEPLEQLGSRLMLPPQHEASRAEIESRLPPLHDPLAAPLASSDDDNGTARSTHA
jgi:glyoxalase family protein